MVIESLLLYASTQTLNFLSNDELGESIALQSFFDHSNRRLRPLQRLNYRQTDDDTSAQGRA